jgi:hypothetical protein
MKRYVSTIIALVVLLSMAPGMRPAVSIAAPQTAGYSDFLYSGLPSPSGDKPPRKLWYNDQDRNRTRQNSSQLMSPRKPSYA